MSEVKKIPEGWLETTLLDATSFLGDGLHGTPNYSDDGEYYFINGNNLNDGKIEIKPETKRCSIDEYNKYKKNLNDRTILVSINGSLGYFAYYNNEKCILGKSACYFNVKENIDKKFIGYQIRSTYFQKYIERLAGGTTIKNVSLKTMREFPFLIPKDINEQKSIADILTAFDNKIELLQAQNKTLEATAQTIFAEWFGKYSVEDELPDGWRVGRLEKIIKYIIDNRGKTPPTIDSKTEGYPLIEVNSITGNDRNININVVRKFVDNHIYENWFRKGHPIKGDILISTVGSIGQLGQVYDEKICIAQNIVALRSTISGNFLYELLKFNQKEIISIDISSVQPSIKVPHLLNIEIIIPDDKTIQKFDTAINSLTNKLFENYKQINMLIKTRDEILPKLLNGMIRIKNN